jgi:hypothetical protein
MKVLESDERMKKCCLSYLGGCDGKIEWHHNLIYAGRQSDVPETILGVCKNHHDQANDKVMKERLDYEMLKLFNPRIHEYFPKSGLHQRMYYLKQKYG